MTRQTTIVYKTITLSKTMFISITDIYDWIAGKKYVSLSKQKTNKFKRIQIHLKRIVFICLFRMSKTKHYGVDIEIMAICEYNTTRDE